MQAAFKVHAVFKYAQGFTLLGLLCFLCTCVQLQGQSGMCVTGLSFLQNVLHMHTVKQKKMCVLQQWPQPQASGAVSILYSTTPYYCHFYQ